MKKKTQRALAQGYGSMMVLPDSVYTFAADLDLVARTDTRFTFYCLRTGAKDCFENYGEFHKKGGRYVQYKYSNIKDERGKLIYQEVISEASDFSRVLQFTKGREHVETRKNWDFLLETNIPNRMMNYLSRNLLPNEIVLLRQFNKYLDYCSRGIWQYNYWGYTFIDFVFNIPDPVARGQCMDVLVKIKGVTEPHLDMLPKHGFYDKGHEMLVYSKIGIMKPQSESSRRRQEQKFDRIEKKIGTEIILSGKKHPNIDLEEIKDNTAPGNSTDPSIEFDKWMFDSYYLMGLFNINEYYDKIIAEIYSEDELTQSQEKEINRLKLFKSKTRLAWKDHYNYNLRSMTKDERASYCEPDKISEFLDIKRDEIEQEIEVEMEDTESDDN